MIMCINYEKIEETTALDLLAMPIQVLLEEFQEESGSEDSTTFSRKTYVCVKAFSV